MTAILLDKMTVAAGSRKSNPLANKLLRGYLHKTSNSLCGIKGYASLIAATESSNQSSTRWARKIMAEIERMEEIFHSVGDMTLSSTSFPSGCDIQGVLSFSVAKEKTRNPELEVVASELPAGQLLLPEADLQLVLTEILRNCSEAKQAALVNIYGQIEITGRVALCLSDNGPGMTSELLGQATDPFVTTRDGHHGVGLTRVETILDMHGLAWSLTSQPGVGTTVTLEVAEALNLNPEIV